MRNGIRTNRYANKRKHKRLQKKQFARRYGRYGDNLNRLEEEYLENYTPWYCRRTPPNNGYEYWQTLYLSGVRQYAKWCTNRAIRAYYRDMIRRLDEEGLEDLAGLTGSDYEKMYDYAYTIW